MLKLSSSKDRILEWEGEEYKLRQPTTIEVMEFTKKHQEVADKPYDVLVLTVDYLDVLGIPKAVLHKMEISHVTAISNYINGTDSAGK
tara:strand:- start:5118 stop:5381 length:264 start_codon:yes stop_codon:yes gene_type:complete